MRPSKTDVEYLALIRYHIAALIKRAAESYDRPGLKVLEIGPGGYDTVRETFTQADIKTLDINPASGADYIRDLSEPLCIMEGFDLVVCTDVLEHVKDPFTAIRNIAGIFNRSGPHIALISTPLNFRQHGTGGYNTSQGFPPDYWRFMEPGLRHLISEVGGMQILEFNRLESDRAFFPIHFTAICRKI